MQELDSIPDVVQNAADAVLYSSVQTAEGSPEIVDHSDNNGKEVL